MSRQSRPVIPPSRPIGKSPTTQAFSLLQKKLNTAEAETTSLVRQLADLGFPVEDGNPHPKTKSGSPDPVAPFLPSTADSEVLHKHYEALVARLCRTESQLQTLKLNLCALQAERDLNREQSASAVANEERLAHLKEEHQEEVRQLNKELVRTRTEWKETLDQRNQALEEARRLSNALEAATTAKSELAVAYEDWMSSRQKMNKRNAELREELAREGSLRRSLEQSHAALLDRIREMEGVVESERQQVQILSSDCSDLRQEGVRIQEEKRNHATRQTRLEEVVKTLRADLGAKEVQLTEIHEENQVLLATLNGIKRENVALRNEMQNSRAVSENTETQVQQFEEERTALYSALTQALSTSTSPSSLRQLITKISEPGSIAIKVTESLRRLEAERARLQSQLTQETQARTTAEQRSSELQMSLQVTEERYQDVTRQNQNRIQSLENSLEELNNELAALRHHSQDTLKAKEHLLEEVNLAVDGMSEETEKLQKELAQSKLELTSLGQDKQYLTEENRRLMERIAALEQQQDAQQKVQSTMAELLDSKNRLAYDKGRLQSRVAQLQEELQSLASARTEGLQLQKANVAMQAQYAKTTSELSSVKVTMQRLESKLRQEQELSGRKEKDFSLAIQARDEVLQECQRLQGQLQVMQDREKQKAASFQRSLADAKTDQAKIAATLEGVMASHKQLQTAVENLQMELGRKDSELSSLRNERQSRQKTMGSLQREVEKLTEKLVTVETLEGTQLDSLRSDMDRALAEKSKLGQTVDELLQTNGKLQATTERIQNQLQKRNHKYKLLQETREREKSDLQAQLEASTDQLQSLQLQLATKRDTSLKNATKEVSQLQQAHQDLTRRIKDLSQANAELHAKVASLEETCSKQRDRISSQKAQLESCSRLRKTNAEMTEKIKGISHQLSEMEAAKREYTRKNSEQAKTISNFVKQVAGLQADLEALSKVQDSLSSSTRKKDRQVEKERIHLQKQAKGLQEALVRLQVEKTDAEEKLLEASNESIQITANLQEAHSWFKGRHDALQQELIEARQRQTQLERTNTEQQQQLLQERMKAAEQAQRARNMIRASRQALSHLARQAEADHKKTKTQMTSMVKRLQAEKDHSTFTDRKLQNFMDISGQYIEELAMELDRHRDGHDDST